MQDAHPPVHDPGQPSVSNEIGDESRRPTNGVRVAVYARVSTSDGRQEVENQLSELRVFAARQGWVVVQEYIDRESGSKADRAEFRRLFADAAQRRFDLALVWALDRLTREGVAETFEHIKRLTSHGVQFASFTEEHFRTTGPAGELMIAVAAWIARQERIRISERVRAGLERACVKGTRSGRAVGPRSLSTVNALLSFATVDVLGGKPHERSGRRLGRCGELTKRQSREGSVKRPSTVYWRRAGYPKSMKAKRGLPKLGK